LVFWWVKSRPMIYRVRQFWHALHSKPLTATDLAPARSVLTEPQMALFTRLQTSEQAHSLRVLQALRNQGENHPDMLVAALLHDVGKICHPLRIWEQVVIVFGKQFFPKRMKQWGCTQASGWKRTFVVASEHPLWGAALAQEAGTSPLAIYLIREHQNDLPLEHPDSEENSLLSTLQAADHQN
jgi:hypothetical protein